jgi:hypothetical protein
MMPLIFHLQPASFWKARTLLSRRPFFLVVSIVMYAVLFTQNVHPAFAVQSKPPTDWSFYIYAANNSDAYTLGCNQGKFDASYSPSVNSEVVLDFGGQNSTGSGTLMTNMVAISNAQIEAYAEQFSDGYWTCLIRLGISSGLILIIIQLQYKT